MHPVGLTEIEKYTKTRIFSLREAQFHRMETEIAIPKVLLQKVTFSPCRLLNW